MAVHNHSWALEFLLDRINYERTTQIPYQSAEFHLDRMRDLAARLGNPHLRVPVVHVAGTKGKGSTASMIAGILQQAGYCTGLYTSPHLERIEERFAIDATSCSAEELVELARRVEPVVRALDEEASSRGEAGPTFFEVTTAMAFLHFAARPVDVAVLEVGLGGRLDSTNICSPAVCVITSISYDHTQQLGSTLTAIAAEKAGILKPGVPAVSGAVDSEASHTIQNIAQQIGAPLWLRERDFSATVLPQSDFAALAGPTIRYRDTLTSDGYEICPFNVNLLGSHQAANAATAIAAIRLLRLQGWQVSDVAVHRGLANVRCPARVEVVRTQPTVVVDAAHNAASVQALCDTLQTSTSAFSRRVLIFATSRDKDVAAMLQVLLPAFDDVILTRYVNNPRARTLDELLPLAAAQRMQLPIEQRPTLHESPDPHQAWQLAQSFVDRDALICITGSFFLAAELRALIAEQSS